MRWIVTLVDSDTGQKLDLGTFEASSPGDAEDAAKKRHRAHYKRLVTGRWMTKATPAPERILE